MRNKKACKMNGFSRSRGGWKHISAILAAAALILVCAALASCGPADEPDRDKEKPTVAIIALHTPDAGENATEAPEPTENPGGDQNTAEPVNETAAPTAAPTEIPTETPTPTPDPEPTPYRDTFLDLDAYRNFYVIPGQEYTFDFGDTSGWTIDTRGVMSASFEGGKLKVNASSTGYAKLSGPNGLRGFIYSSKAVEKTDARKVRDGFPYYIYFEKGSHTMTVYAADSDGYYTVPVRTINSASGSTPAKTPVGTFTLGEKMRWKTFSTYCHAQFVIQYASGVFLHGPCYSEKRVNSILSHYYNTIGENSSGGCLRMQTGNIYWIYTNCPEGTTLEIVDGNPRGTDSEKPAEIPEAACYDPTDPALAGVDTN
ncbi:MAG: L,D-transpeptidase [Clostridia bacterium]|nr:L,D-transpeptidase [Clostridia bacterium]